MSANIFLINRIAEFVVRQAWCTVCFNQDGNFLPKANRFVLVPIFVMNWISDCFVSMQRMHCLFSIVMKKFLLEAVKKLSLS